MEPLDRNLVTSELPNVRKLSVSPTSVTLEPGGTAQLSVTVWPRAAWNFGDVQVLWTSADPTVASVNAQGLVTAIAQGVTTVTASVGDISSSSTVTVSSGSGDPPPPPPPPPPSGTQIPTLADWSEPISVLPSGNGTWPGGNGDWDFLLGGGPTPAVVTRYNGTWYLYYIGAPSYNEAEDAPEWRAIGVATSPDGENFTKHPSNPIVTFAPTPQFEEGAVSVALLTPDRSGDGKWHMWYGGNVSTGSGLIDMQIRHRESNDGILWTDDVLVKYLPGNELKPIAAYYASGTYSVFYVHSDGPGGGSAGAGPLRRLHGSNPTTPLVDELVTSSYLAAGNYAVDATGRLIWQFHVSNTSPGQYQWRVMDPQSLNVLGEPVESFTMTGYRSASVYLDVATGEWSWYQLFVGVSPAEVRLRTALP